MQRFSLQLLIKKKGNQQWTWYAIERDMTHSVTAQKKSKPIHLCCHKVTACLNIIRSSNNESWLYNLGSSLYKTVCKTALCGTDTLHSLFYFGGKSSSHPSVFVSQFSIKPRQQEQSASFMNGRFKKECKEEVTSDATVSKFAKTFLPCSFPGLQLGLWDLASDHFSLMRCFT